MRKGVRTIAAVTLLAVALSGSTTSAAQRRTDHPASRGDTTVFARFIVWVNSRLSPPIGITDPPPESRQSPPSAVALPTP
jgi:hypothetical protein